MTAERTEQAPPAPAIASAPRRTTPQKQPIQAPVYEPKSDEEAAQPSLDFGFGPTDFTGDDDDDEQINRVLSALQAEENAERNESQQAVQAAQKVAAQDGTQADTFRQDTVEMDALPQSVIGMTGSSDVFFIPLRTQRKRSLLERIDLALTRSGIADMIFEGDKVALKLHFGETGNTGFVSPLYVRAVVERIKKLGGKPFLTDTNTLYSGHRTNAVDHLNCAIANGFGYSSVGAPIIIADGLISRDSVEVPISGGRHFESVRIASAAYDADVMIAISHVKGHAESGFGAAIKNVGMGLGSRGAKQRMHSGIKPDIAFDSCTACGRCVDWCPEHCINMQTGANGARHAAIAQDSCIGCGECLAACAYDAIAINWESPAEEFLEKTAEHAYGALAHFDGKVAYLNVLTNITPDCDCWEFSDAPVVPDIGILASRDIVAIDQASLDLITEAYGAVGSLGESLSTGEEKFHAIHGTDATHTMRYSEALGMGTRNYRLRQVG
jgi:uncharacterized Fe-S center protein